MVEEPNAVCIIYNYIEQLIQNTTGTIECSKQTFMHTIMLMKYKE